MLGKVTISTIFLFLQGLVVPSRAQATVPSTVPPIGNPCPCVNETFNVIRWVRDPEAQNKVFSIMQSQYESAADILSKALAVGTFQGLNEAVDGMNFIMDSTAKCMYGVVMDGVFNIDGTKYEADFEISGFAISRGLSLSVCNCKQKDFKTGDVDICNDYLRLEAEVRMNDVACNL